jgi:hypothetical protein
MMCGCYSTQYYYCISTPIRNGAIRYRSCEAPLTTALTAAMFLL